MYASCDYSNVLLLYAKAASACPELVREILALRPADFDLESDGERGLPGELAYRKNGWWQHMLARYFFAGSFFCRNKNVLELCSGLGWGARIVSEYACSVTGLELDAEVVERAGKVWADRSNIRWIRGDALRAAEMVPGEFDIVLGMEAVEHFNYEDGAIFIGQAHGLLKDGGTFIMSSFFPNTRQEAEDALSRAPNPYHLNLFTCDEIATQCAGLFSEVSIYGNLLAVLRK